MKKLDLANPKLALVPLCMIGLCGMLFLTGCDTSAASALVSGATKGQSVVASGDDANGANQAPATTQAPAPGATDYDDGNTNYDDGATDYDGNSVYESGDSLYDDSWDDGNSGYDDGASAYVAPAPAPAASAPAVSAPATGNSGYSNYNSDSGYDADSGYDSDSGYDD
mgnify:FL=1